MIKFFRKIRYNLMEQNKTGKYFKYALGEILLVMIGILLALQVNNWNENRKLQTKSLDYLYRLKVDLDNVSAGVSSSLLAAERKYHQALVALEVLETKKLPYTKCEDFENHLKQYFQFEFTIQNTTAYNEMLSSGDLGLIKNEWMRNAFADLSDEREFIIEVNKSNHNAYKNNMELIEKHVRYHVLNIDTDSTKIDVVYDFDAMANDKLFINQVSNQAYTWYDILRLYKRYERDVNIIKDSVRIELDNFK
ncbi:DUF6090 family protein [Flavobacteriaceae bacterium S0862]|nr:DUF6090 family protein [Flavobacteriaceae bacterium S0862]